MIDSLHKRELPPAAESPYRWKSSCYEDAGNARMEEGHCAHDARFEHQVGVTPGAEVTTRCCVCFPLLCALLRLLCKIQSRES